MLFYITTQAHLDFFNVSLSSKNNINSGIIKLYNGSCHLDALQINYQFFSNFLVLADSSNMTLMNSVFNNNRFSSAASENVSVFAFSGNNSFFLLFNVSFTSNLFEINVFSLPKFHQNISFEGIFASNNNFPSFLTNLSDSNFNLMESYQMINNNKAIVINKICPQNYIGPLCQSCQKGFTKNGGQNCKQCPDKGLSIFIVLLMGSLSLVIAVLYFK